jgi:preprotein translocase subunit SecB
METYKKENQLESGFRITNLILLKSDFNRVAIVTFDNEKVKQTINVNVDVNTTENTIFVTEKIEYSQSFNGQDEVNCTIVMAGVFEKTGTTELKDLEQFGRVNGAAIIFPYIREHLSNLSYKAGIGLIVLPPMNFTATTTENAHKQEKLKPEA